MTEVLHRPSAILHISDGNGKTLCGLGTQGVGWQWRFKHCPECYVRCAKCDRLAGRSAGYRLTPSGREVG